jgi:hypothetical protein
MTDERKQRLFNLAEETSFSPSYKYPYQEDPKLNWDEASEYLLDQINPLFLYQVPENELRVLVNDEREQCKILAKNTKCETFAETILQKMNAANLSVNDIQSNAGYYDLTGSYKLLCWLKRKIVKCKTRINLRQPAWNSRYQMVQGNMRDDDDNNINDEDDDINEIIQIINAMDDDDGDDDDDDDWDDNEDVQFAMETLMLRENARLEKQQRRMRLNEAAYLGDNEWREIDETIANNVMDLDDPMVINRIMFLSNHLDGFRGHGYRSFEEARAVERNEPYITYANV